MLALLTRMVEDGWLNPAPSRRLEGWVQDVKQEASRGRPVGYAAGSNYAGAPDRTPTRPSFPQSQTPASPRYIITLSTPQAGSKDYLLAAGAALFGTPLPGPQGLYNRHVLVVLNKRNEIAFARAYEPRTPVQANISTGTIEKVVQARSLQVIIRNLDHDLHTHATDWATTVPPGGIPSLKTGQWVKVALHGETIWQLETLEVKKVSGNIESIGDRKLYLDKFDKTLGNLFLDWERARLSAKDGTPYNGAGLKPGDSVEITCLDWDKVLEIKVR